MGRGQILDRVISGLQTGVDQVGLAVARELHYKTGGTCPKGFRTDAGPAPELAALYGVKEHPWSSGYAPRTAWNVAAADATVWFGVESPGYKCTLSAVRINKRHLIVVDGLESVWLENPSVSELQDFLIKNGVVTLNVAGNRLRTHPESADRARIVLLGGLIPF